MLKLHTLLRARAGEYSDDGNGDDYNDDDLEENLQDDDDDDDDDLGDDDDDSNDDDDDDSSDDDDDSPPARRPKQRRAAAPAIDTSGLSAALIQGLTPVLQQSRAEQPKQKSMEELIGRTKLPKELIKKLRDPEASEEEVAGAMEELFADNLDRAIKALGYGLTGFQDKLAPQQQAIQTFIHQKQVADFTSDVVRKYPALRGQTRNIHTMMSQMAASGFQGSREQAIRQVAIKTRDLIRTVDGNFSLKPKQRGNGATRPRAGGGGNRGAKSSNSWMDSF